MQILDYPKKLTMDILTLPSVTTKAHYLTFADGMVKRPLFLGSRESAPTNNREQAQTSDTAKHS